MERTLCDAGDRTRRQARAGRRAGAHGRGHGVVLRRARRARHRDGNARRSCNSATLPRNLRAAGVALELGGHGDETFLAQDLIVPESRRARRRSALGGSARRSVSHLERNRTGLAFSRGRIDRHHRFERQNNDHLACRPHSAKRPAIPAIARGKYRHAADCLRRTDERETRSRSSKLSSFQLELIDTFRPDVAVFLNLTPDHLDRHETLRSLRRAKARIFENQTELDAAVLNADDRARRRSTRPRGRRCTGSAASKRVARAPISVAKTL